MADASTRSTNYKEYTDAFMIVVVCFCFCFLVAMFLLRFCCNIAIDVCILGDMASARRRIHDFWILALGPFSRVIYVEEEAQPVHAAGGDDTDLARLMRRLSSQEKSLLMDSILTRKVRAIWLFLVYRRASRENVSFTSWLTYMRLIVSFCLGCNHRRSWSMER
jgi:hypothetical protein